MTESLEEIKRCGGGDVVDLGGDEVKGFSLVVRMKSDTLDDLVARLGGAGAEDDFALLAAQSGRDQVS